MKQHITKTCRTCHKEKELASFYKMKLNSDGYNNECKDCKKTYQAERRKDPAYRAKHREHSNKFYLAHKDDPTYKANRLKSYYKYTQANPLKKKAHDIVNDDLRDGRIVKKPCEVCGEIRVHAHHDDYNKPRNVRWLCQLHHEEVHHGATA